MTALAAELRLSGRGLAKVCARLQVSVPPRGYWAKLMVGKAVTKPDLPAATDGTPAETVITPTSPRTEPALPSDVEAQIKQVLETRANICVPVTLAKPHALVKGWLERDRERMREHRASRLAEATAE
jgi:hypothetical protein